MASKDYKILTRKLDIVEEKKDEEMEDIIILSDNSTDEITAVFSADDDDDIQDLTNKYPPCIRAILIESKENKLGTLFIIPYTGGTIGRDSRSNLIDFSYEMDIEEKHASIKYDMNKKEYFIEGFYLI